MVTSKLAWIGALVFGTGGAALLLATSPIPGGLTPPAGPVADTTPSLADIASEIEALRFAISNPIPVENRVVRLVGNPQSPRVLSSGNVYIERIIVMTGGASVTDGAGHSVVPQIIAGRQYIENTGNQIGSSYIIANPVSYELGLSVVGPVSLQFDALVSGPGVPGGQVREGDVIVVFRDIPTTR